MGLAPAPEAPPAAQPLWEAAARPVAFEKNLGQWDAEAEYRILAGGYEAFLTPSKLVLAFSDVPAGGVGAARSGGTAVTMSFVGADPRPEATAEQPATHVSHYLLGNDPAKWVTDVPSFGQVVYHDLYPGIDLVYHGDPSGGLKYDFVVRPGGDPGAIRLRFEGQDALWIDADGTLALRAAGQERRQGAPLTFQDAAAVENRYVLGPDGAVGFELGPYDPTRTLVIDPLVYSTYLGGSDVEDTDGDKVAVDASGNAYVVVGTYSSDYPVTSGAYRTTRAGSIDIAVTKLSPTGSLVYSTYIGSSGAEAPHAIAVDSAGAAYVVGWTNSRSFPTTSGAFQRSGGSSNEVFVTKLNPTGSGLSYSTYLGGNDADTGNAIAVDASGNAYVTGHTFSTNFPTTTGAYQRSSGGGGRADAFLTKLNAAGSALVYSTYLATAGEEIGNGVAVDASGNAYVAGGTDSFTFPTTPGAFQRVKGDSDPYGTDVFVAKFNAAGSGLAYATYVGGSRYEQALAIAVDASGSAYAAGLTTSLNYPVTSGAFQTVRYPNVEDAFVTKLTPDGSGLAYSTYLGGATGYGLAFGIAVDANGIAYVGGETFAEDFPVTAGAHQTAKSDPMYCTGNGMVCAEGFVTLVNPAGSGLLYSTYFGGWGNDYVRGIAVRGQTAYVAGHTESSSFPTTPGAPKPTGSGYNAFAAAFSFAGSVPGAPRSLQATTLSNAIRLTWAAPLSDGGSPIVGYDVLRGPTAGSQTLYQTLGNVLTYTDFGVETGATYYYSVRARNAVGPGLATGPVSAGLPPVVLAVDFRDAVTPSDDVRVRVTVQDRISTPLSYTVANKDGVVYRSSSLPLVQEGTSRTYAATIPRASLGDTIRFSISGASLPSDVVPASRVFDEVRRIALLPAKFQPAQPGDSCVRADLGLSSEAALRAWLAGQAEKANAYMVAPWGGGASLGYDFDLVTKPGVGWTTVPHTCDWYNSFDPLTQLAGDLVPFGDLLFAVLGGGELDTRLAELQFVYDAELSSGQLARLLDADTVIAIPMGQTRHSTDFDGRPFFMDFPLVPSFLGWPTGTIVSVASTQDTSSLWPYATWLHELGHDNGNPDFYPSFFSGAGNLGRFDLMGCGNSRGVFHGGTLYPAPYSVVTRTKQGWMDKDYSGVVPFTTKDWTAVYTESRMHGDDATVILSPIGETFYAESRLADSASQKGVVLYEEMSIPLPVPYPPQLYRHVSAQGQSGDPDPCDSGPLPTLRAGAESFYDAPNLLRFTLDTGHSSWTSGQAPFHVKVKYDALSWVRGVRLWDWNPLGGLFTASGEAPPSMDLHASTPDGRHVGMNYATGQFENQIAGAHASGSRADDEWIFVPESENATFYVTPDRPGEAVNATYVVQDVKHGDVNVTETAEGVQILGRTEGRYATFSNQTFEANASVVLDGTPPLVAITGPSPGLVAADVVAPLPDPRAVVVVGNATLAFQVEDLESGVASIELWRDGVLVASHPGGTRALPLDATTLVSGCQVVEVKAVNAFGVVGNASLELAFLDASQNGTGRPCSWSDGDAFTSGPCLPPGPGACVRFDPIVRWGDLVADETGAPLARGSLTLGGATAPFPGWLGTPSPYGATPESAFCLGGACNLSLVADAAPEATVAQLWLGRARVFVNGTEAGAAIVARPLDRAAPALGMPGDVTLEATGPEGAFVTYAATAEDLLDGSVPVSCAPASGSAFPLGDTTVTCTASDAGGMTASATFRVRVTDTTPPSVAPHPDVQAAATSTLGAFVGYALPEATDLAGGPVDVTCSPASGSRFAPGQTSVVCTARDARGNARTTGFTVWVTYSWSGVLVVGDGSTTQRAGANINVRFTLTDASAGISNLPARLYYAPVGGTEQPAAPSGSGTGNLFAYSPSNGQYTFSWSTKGLATGAYVLRADFGDGVMRTADVTLT